MKLSRCILATLFVFSLTSLQLQAQLFEDFESGEKTFYAGASVALSTGDWYLDDALIGSLSNDKFNGSLGVRMDRRDGKTGNIYMQFDKSGGADEVSFYLAHYGNNQEDAALQVQYSTDGGSNWINIGDEIPAPADLTEYTIPVQIDGNIRFKFVQSSGTDRMNIDDIRITDFIDPQDEATIEVTVDDIVATNGNELDFSKVLIGTTSEKSIEIKNIGNTALVIDTVTLTGQGFSISDLSDDTLSFNETTSLTITFAPQQAGPTGGTIVFSSNAINFANYTLDLAGEGFEDGDLITISEARTLPIGTRVTVTGRVTTANEFGGPLYMQDETAGIAVFWEPLHSTAIIGDSVTVTGPLTVFKPIAGPDSDFLLQISDTDTDDNIIFEIIEAENRVPDALPVNIEQLNSGNYQSQLVVVQNATIGHTGAFQGNTNYTVSDNTGEAELRIDNNTNLVGANAPEGATNIVGVIGKFGGIEQLLPRFTDDLGVEEVSYPGDDISKDETLDVVTWNIEWFGDPDNGPTDDQLQLQNVQEVITTLDADIYALQEISNTSLFTTLDENLTGYSGIIADYSQSQKTAYLYKNTTIQPRSSGLITQGMTQSDWANGRFPLEFVADVAINNEIQEIYFYNIHAKAFAEESDYFQRINASGEIKNYLDNNRSEENVILLGDFNDEILSSSYNGIESPYANFDEDTEYTIVTKSLEENGYTSYSRFSMIDHIVFTSELSDEYFQGTERVENPFYIGSYLSETSDHFPVWTRFRFGEQTNTEFTSGEVLRISLEQNYPNPFNPSTTIRYSLDQSTKVTLEVFDITGRKIADLVNGLESAGQKSVRFDASSLSSGVYIYRLNAGGELLTRKMILVK